MAVFTFTLDSFQITDTRSRHEDTDYVTYTLLVKAQDGSGTPRMLTKYMGEVQGRAGRGSALRRRVPGRCPHGVLLIRGRPACRAEWAHPHPTAERRVAALLEPLRCTGARLAAARVHRGRHRRVGTGWRERSR